MLKFRNGTISDEDALCFNFDEIFFLFDAHKTLLTSLNYCHQLHRAIFYLLQLIKWALIQFLSYTDWLKSKKRFYLYVETNISFHSLKQMFNCTRKKTVFLGHNWRFYFNIECIRSTFRSFTSRTEQKVIQGSTVITKSYIRELRITSEPLICYSYVDLYHT